MVDKYVLATSAGFVPTDRWGVLKPGKNFLRAIELSGKERPNVLFVMTASGDSPTYLNSSYQAVSGLGVNANHLALFTQPTQPVEESVGNADVIWVGGGSVANLLAVWQLHGVDVEMKKAYERGAILGGVSAGSICWHVGGPTDSFGPELKIINNGLGIIQYGAGVHYDSEAQRRPLLQKTVQDGILPTSFSTDDRIGLLYKNGEPFEVISDLETEVTETSPAAYRIEKIGDKVKETRLSPGLLH
ncbi:MAG: peptidase E [Actinobacteria bacterium]|nr:peptidase E [Actinomycetota bacterium]